MPYIHEYINRQELSESIKFTLKLTDDEGILPEQFIPIILYKSEFCEERLLDIANHMIQTCTKENTIVEVPVVEVPVVEVPVVEVPVVDTPIVTEETNDLSTQSGDNIPSDQLNIQ